MFYRFGKGDIRLAIDMDNIFLGEALFIAGGAPSLARFAADIRGYSVGGLRFEPPILAINNAGMEVPASLWVGGDKPVCYSESILCDPVPMKFGVISRHKETVNGRPWAEWPNTYFFGTKEDFNRKNFLHRNRDLVWWKNTFFIALQLAYRLGFRRAYLVGCGFKISKEAQYAWRTHLGDDEIKWNQRLYGDTVNVLRDLLPTLDAGGFKIVSCTEDSAANEFLPFRHHEEVLSDMLKERPGASAEYKPHSSKVGDTSCQTTRSDTKARASRST